MIVERLLVARKEPRIWGASGWAAVRVFLPLIPFSTFLLLFLPPLRFCLNRGQRRPEWFSFLQSHTRLLALFLVCICGEESSGVTHGVFKLVNLLNDCTLSSDLPPGGFLFASCSTSSWDPVR